MKKYITVPAIVTRDNQIIPVWDERVTFIKDDYYGDHLTVEDSHEHYQPTDVVYDLKTKKLSMGIEIDSYPTEDRLDFKKGQEVYHEQGHRSLVQTSVVDILFEEFEVDIKKGKKIEEYQKKDFKDIVLQTDEIYVIKRWKPTYVLANGRKTKWEHELYKKS